MNTWCTKEDVLADLARASGWHVPDMDEGCFVYGERAPPPRTAGDEDAEVEQRFGRVSGVGAQQLPAADLRGITKMLRMVQNYGDADCPKADTSPNDVIVISKLNPHNSKQGSTTPKSTNEVTLSKKLNHISSNRKTTQPTSDLSLSSKLNPDVKEFVPKWKALSSSSQIIEPEPKRALANEPAEAASAGGACKANNNCKSLQIEQQKTDSVNTIDINTNISNKSVQVADQCQIERDELASMLRNRIHSAPNEEDNGFEFRRKKYAAIANLLKLHSTPLPPTLQPVKLCTPDFFENYKATDLARPDAETNEATADISATISDDRETTLTPKMEATLNLEVKDAPNEGKADHIGTNQMEAKFNLGVKDVLNVGLTDHIAMDKGVVTSNPKPELELEKEVTDAVDQLEMRASIHKVRNWFDNKPCVPSPPACATSPLSPALHLGPIAYKRKERAGGVARSPLGAVERKLPRSSAGADRVYVPSQYALELGRQFTARGDALEQAAAPSITIWEKLELDLKKKDAEIRERADRRDAPAPDS